MDSFWHESTNIEAQGVVNGSVTFYYETVLQSFIEKSIILQSIPEEYKLGIFLYSLKINRIVYGNESFLNYYQFKKEHLTHPAIRRFIFSRFHPEDALTIRNLEIKAIGGEEEAYLNKVIRIRMYDNIYHSCHFLVLNLGSMNPDYEDLRVGVQISLSSFSDTIDNKTELTICRRKIADLSKRECDILRLIVKGFTDNEIGQQLHISTYTSQKHRKNILKKLQVKNTALLSYIAGKSNLI